MKNRIFLIIILALCLSSCSKHDAGDNSSVAEPAKIVVPEIVFLNVNKSENGNYLLTFWDNNGNYYSCDDKSVYPSTFEALIEKFVSENGDFVCHKQTCDRAEIETQYRLLCEIAHDNKYELDTPKYLPDVIARVVTLYGLYYDSDGTLCYVPLHKEKQQVDIYSIDDRANEIYAWYMESIKLK